MLRDILKWECIKMSVFKGIKVLPFSIFVLMFLCLSVSISFAEDKNTPKITALTLGNWGTYPAADIWMTFGADYETASENDEVQIFLVDSPEKKVDEAIFSGSKCSVQDVPSSGYMRGILGEKQEFGFLIHDLEPGKYYVGCKLSDSSGNSDYMYKPFTVYSCAKDYTKEALDRVIYSYIKGPDGWYWKDGQYVGLGYNTDVYGNSWESWMFPALGSSYEMNDGTVLDFSKDGPVLSSYDGRWFKDQACEWPITGAQSKLWQTVGSTEGAKHILAFCAYGEDPRNINSLDLVKSVIQILYNQDGTIPGYEKDKAMGESIADSYMLLALEAAGATPQEGYTRLLRNSYFSGMWETDLDGGQDYVMATPDSFAMTKLALPMFGKYPQYTDTVNTVISKLNATVDYNMYENGAMAYSTETDNNEKYKLPNADSLAVVINSLVINGLRVEDFDQGKFTKHYGSLLTSLGSCVVEDGVVYGDKANRMATYQALGALVDLYCNKSCFEIAAEKYREAHPEYFAEGYGKLSFKSVSEVSDQTFTGEAVVPKVEVVGEMPNITPRQPVYGVEIPIERKLEEGLDYTVEYRNNTEPGKATIVVTGIGDYYDTREITFNIVKEDNGEEQPIINRRTQPMTVKTVKKAVSFKKLKVKAQVVKGALIVKNSKGTVTYNKKSGYKKLTINRTTGGITVKKKTKKGTYKIKVRVKADGNKLYKAGSKTVNVKITVK